MKTCIWTSNCWCGNLALHNLWDHQILLYFSFSCRAAIHSISVFRVLSCRSCTLRWKYNFDHQTVLFDRISYGAPSCHNDGLVDYTDRFVGLGVWFSLKLREVPVSNPGRSHLIHLTSGCHRSYCRDGFWNHFVVHDYDLMKYRKPPSVSVKTHHWIIKYNFLKSGRHYYSSYWHTKDLRKLLTRFWTLKVRVRVRVRGKRGLSCQSCRVCWM